MSVVLDAPVRAGGTVVAALSRVRVTSHGADRRAMFFCHKVPVAILCREGGSIRAMAIDGAPLTPEQVERLCPGAMDDFAGLAASFLE